MRPPDGFQPKGGVDSISYDPATILIGVSTLEAPGWIPGEVHLLHKMSASMPNVMIGYFCDAAESIGVSQIVFVDVEHGALLQFATAAD